MLYHLLVPEGRRSPLRGYENNPAIAWEGAPTALGHDPSGPSSDWLKAFRYSRPNMLASPERAHDQRHRRDRGIKQRSMMSGDMTG